MLQWWLYGHFAPPHLWFQYLEYTLSGTRILESILITLYSPTRVPVSCPSHRAGWVVGALVE